MLALFLIAIGVQGCVGLDPSEGTASLSSSGISVCTPLVALGSTRVRVLQGVSPFINCVALYWLRWARPE